MRWQRPAWSRAALVEKLEDPVGVLPNSRDVAKHPLRGRVIGHPFQCLLPVDVLHARSQTLGKHAQSDEQRSSNEHFLHELIMTDPNWAE